MSTVISHPDIAIDWLRTQLDVADLTSLQVNGVSIQDVFYLVAPQDTPDPYPCVIINQPFISALAQRLQKNGPWISSASFDVDLRFVARDVEPDNADLRAVRAKAIELCEGLSGSVTGGRVNSCIVWTFPPDQRRDSGTYIYSECMVTLRLGVQVD